MTRRGMLAGLIGAGAASVGAGERYITGRMDALRAAELGLWDIMVRLDGVDVTADCREFDTAAGWVDLVRAGRHGGHAGRDGSYRRYGHVQVINRA